MTAKRHFGRPNWPFIAQWAAGGEQQPYYSISDEVAALWREFQNHLSRQGAAISSAPTDGVELSASIRSTYRDTGRLAAVPSWATGV